jgi:hypothetical protein
MTSYLQEQNRFVIKQNTSSSKTTYKQYVCKPNYRNVTAVHDVLRRIIEDIDINQKLHPTKRILDRLGKQKNIFLKSYFSLLVIENNISS